MVAWTLPSSSFSVTVTITDDDGNISVALLNATVSNVAPALQLPSNAVVDDSNTYQGSGSFTDPGNDSWSGTIDYGDGSGVQQLALNGKNFSPDHDYADYGVYQVSVTISDDDGSATVGVFSVEIRHVCPQHTGLPAPSTDLNGDYKCEDVNGNGRLDFAVVVLQCHRDDYGRRRQYQRCFVKCDSLKRSTRPATAF